MEPTPPPTGQPAPRPQGSIKWPLLINGGLMLVLYLVASELADGHRSETAYAYFFALIGLFFLNVPAAIVAAAMGRRQTLFGVLFSGLFIFLVGLGSCAFVLTHIGGE